MNKDNKDSKNEKKNIWMDIAAWSIVIIGILLVILGIVFGIIQMANEIAEGDATVGIPTLKLSLSLFFATLIAFAIIFAAIYFLFWDKIKTGLDDRKKNVESNIAIAKFKSDEAEKNFKISEDEIKKAELEGKEIINESKKEAIVVKKEIMTDAKDQSEELLTQSREQIEIEKKQMESQIRQEILETSLLAAEKIIEKELDEDANKKMINDLIKSLK